MNGGALASGTQSKFLMYGFMSSIGVPLKASKPLTSRTLFFLFSSFTTASPIQFGRIGDLVLNTPLTGRFGSRFGCTFLGNGMPAS